MSQKGMINCAILDLIILIAFILYSINTGMDSNLIILASIGILVGIPIIIGIIDGTINARKIIKQDKAILEQKKREGYIERIIVSLCSGLPIPRNLDCELKYFRDKITIKFNNDIYNLPMDKIIDMAVTTDVEVQKHIVSNAGGAVAGGMTFGAIGAAIGGRLREVDVNNYIYYLVITFGDYTESKYIVLETDYPNTALNMIKDFKENNVRYKREINL